MDDTNDGARDQSANKKPPVLIVRSLLGIVLGGLAGFGLYRFVGCPDGTCPITSSPWGSIVYCMILGFVVARAVTPLGKT